MPSDLPSSARMDPALCLAPGLFRSLGPGERSKARAGGPVRLAYPHGKTQFTFCLPELLGCDDMRVLQAIVSLAPRPSSLAISSGTTDQPYARLRNRLQLDEGVAREVEVLAVSMSFAELARAAGYDPRGGGGLRRQLATSLRRMADVAVTTEADGMTSVWRMLAHDLDDGVAEGKLTVALDPRSSQSALALRHFANVNMGIARSLRTNAARLLHHHLSALVDAKRPPRALRIGTMMGYVWQPASQEGSVRKRRVLAKSALQALHEAGWSIEPMAAFADTRLVAQLTPGGIEARRVLVEKASLVMQEKGWRIRPVPGHGGTRFVAHLLPNEAGTGRQPFEPASEALRDLGWGVDPVPGAAGKRLVAWLTVEAVEEAARGRGSRAQGVPASTSRSQARSGVARAA